MRRISRGLSSLKTSDYESTLVSVVVLCPPRLQGPELASFLWFKSGAFDSLSEMTRTPELADTAVLKTVRPDAPALYLRVRG